MKDVVNEIIKIGLAKSNGTLPRWDCKTYDLGGSFDYAKAWEKVDELETQAVADKLEIRK